MSFNASYIERISIHALVKRATGAIVLDVSKVDISIHALVKRATMRFISADKNSFYFNPRPREEGDIAVVFVPEDYTIFQSTPS